MNDPSEPPRKARADSLRNRERLLSAARAAFTEGGADVALEEIARWAGVGIGTLYRHFPTRESLLVAVYRLQVDQICAAADTLLAQHPPLEALERWLSLLVDYMGAKRVIAPVLQASPGEGQAAYAASGPALAGAVTHLIQAALHAGAIRPDITPDDVFRMITGLSQGYDQPAWEPSARRLIGVLVAGLRAG